MPPENTRKPLGFIMFSGGGGGVKWEQWSEMRQKSFMEASVLEACITFLTLPKQIIGLVSI